MSRELIPPDDAIESIAGYTWLDERGFVIALSTPQELHTIEHAKASIAALASLSKGKRYPVLVDISHVRSMSREARTYYSGPEPEKYNNALAMVTGSNFGKIVANFFISLTSQRIPTRMFTKIEEAEAWLMQFVDKD